MGYCSNVMIAVTKRDFKKIENAQKKIPDNSLLEDLEIENYKENDIECVFAHFGYIKYYKEYEEVKVLEKTLNKLKDGYVFCRMGEESADIEFRNRTELPELMKNFDFIKTISEDLNKELKVEDKNENSNKDLKSLAWRVDEEFKKEIKEHIAKRGLTLQDYITGLIKEDLDKETIQEKNIIDQKLKIKESQNEEEEEFE